MKGPEIVLEGIDDSITTQDKTLFLTGKILHSSFITINGRPIFVDESGNFNEKLLLSSGVSIIDIYAKDKFGKEVRRKIDVLYNGHPSNVDLSHVASVAIAEASSGTSTEQVVALKAEEPATSTQPDMQMSLMSQATTTPSGE